MSQSWDYFLDEVDNESGILPPILKQNENIPKNEPVGYDPIPSLSGMPPRPNSIPPPQIWSGPYSNFVSLDSQHSNDQNPIEEYYFVQFHPNRTLLVKNIPRIPLVQNEYVITEADRGFDIGRVVRSEPHPLEKDAITARNILRRASQQEIAMIPSKQAKESKAREVCQEKANELGLPMRITATELQFDGKKLTVYFTANQYIDFRNLVHTLFRVFGTRIWMVWYDGSAPVRDVFTHHSRDRRMTMD